MSRYFVMIIGRHGSVITWSYDSLGQAEDLFDTVTQGKKVERIGDFFQIAQIGHILFITHSLMDKQVAPRVIKAVRTEDSIIALIEVKET